MSSSNFKQHFDMISMHEPVQRKARFWTSYVRALKGTEDIRANDDSPSKRRQRPFTEIPDIFPRLFDDVPSSYSEEASSRIKSPGYRYVPVSRETYGCSPRATAPSAYQPTTKYIARR